MNTKDDLEQVRREIIKKYARLKRNGDPMFCKPSARELENPVLRREHENTDGKVIYDNFEKAEDSARELMERGGSDAQYPYPCGRSKNGHVHLSRDRDVLKKLQAMRAVHKEIKQELRSRNRRKIK